MKRKILIPERLRQQIRKEIQNGKSKYQTAKEHGLAKEAIYRITKDLPSKPCGWPGIRGETLVLLQELLTKGYAFHSCKNIKQRYQVLRKYFPTIRKVKIYGKNMFFLEDKGDAAARAFLMNTKKKIMSYQELKQITTVFDADLNKQEKQGFVSRFRT